MDYRTSQCSHNQHYRIERHSRSERPLFTAVNVNYKSAYPWRGARGKPKARIKLLTTCLPDSGVTYGLTRNTRRRLHPP